MSEKQVYLTPRDLMAIEDHDLRQKVGDLLGHVVHADAYHAAAMNNLARAEAAEARLSASNPQKLVRASSAWLVTYMAAAAMFIIGLAAGAALP